MDGDLNWRCNSKSGVAKPTGAVFFWFWYQQNKLFIKVFLFNDLKRLWFRYIIKLRYRVFNYFIYLFGEFIFYFLAEAGAGAAKMANTKLKMTLLRLCMLRKSPVK